MKKFFKTLLYIIIVIVVVVGSYIAYIYFSESTQRNAFSIIPDDSIFIVETKNLNEAWTAVSESKIWHHLTSSA